MIKFLWMQISIWPHHWWVISPSITQSHKRVDTFFVYIFSAEIYQFKMTTNEEKNYRQSVCIRKSLWSNEKCKLQAILARWRIQELCHSFKSHSDRRCDSSATENSMVTTSAVMCYLSLRRPNQNYPIHAGRHSFFFHHSVVQLISPFFFYSFFQSIHLTLLFSLNIFCI